MGLALGGVAREIFIVEILLTATPNLRLANDPADATAAVRLFETAAQTERLALPFHDTWQFARILSTIKLPPRWAWLSAQKKKKVPLDRATLVQHSFDGDTLVSNGSDVSVDEVDEIRLEKHPGSGTILTTAEIPQQQQQQRQQQQRLQQLEERIDISLVEFICNMMEKMIIPNGSNASLCSFFTGTMIEFISTAQFNDDLMHAFISTSAATLELLKMERASDTVLIKSDSESTLNISAPT
ncbi:hypothetical protein BDR26DRAFT_928732 [Obelidium mucronatum]|nr:hypothetical protein BDR26DRAFT_928732 [Obelidium mucronatum]